MPTIPEERQPGFETRHHHRATASESMPASAHREVPEGQVAGAPQVRELRLAAPYLAFAAYNTTGSCEYRPHPAASAAEAAKALHFKRRHPSGSALLREFV